MHRWLALRTAANEYKAHRTLDSQEGSPSAGLRAAGARPNRRDLRGRKAGWSHLLVQIEMLRWKLGPRELGCSNRGPVPAGCPPRERGTARTPPRRSPSDGLRVGADGARSTRPSVRSWSARYAARTEGESWSPSLTSRVPARRPGVAARAGRRTPTAANGRVRSPSARVLDPPAQHRGGSDREARGVDPQAQSCVQTATRSERMSGST
jgi:hypothetical protein